MSRYPSLAKGSFQPSSNMNLDLVPVGRPPVRLSVVCLSVCLSRCNGLLDLVFILTSCHRSWRRSSGPRCRCRGEEARTRRLRGGGGGRGARAAPEAAGTLRVSSESCVAAVCAPLLASVAPLLCFDSILPLFLPPERCAVVGILLEMLVMVLMVMLRLACGVCSRRCCRYYLCCSVVAAGGG